MGRFYDYEKDRYIQTENKRNYSYEQIKNDSIGENKISHANYQRKKNNKKKERNKRILILFMLATLGVTAVHAIIDRLIDNSKDNQLYNAAKAYYGQVVNDATFRPTPNYVDYHNDEVAAYISQCDEIDFDSLMFICYDSYGFYPDDQMQDVLSELKSRHNYAPTANTEEAIKYANFKDYYTNGLGFESEEDYNKNMSKDVVKELKETALLKLGENDFIIEFNSEKEEFVVNENYGQTFGGRN